MDTDVLIVGAGPTGLMLACQLARRGVRALIIDRHAGPARETRALGVQARTLEIYARLGIVEQALALGQRAEAANLWSLGRHAARVPLGDIGRDLSPYPYLFILGQDDNERLLGEKLRELGGEVRWNTELTALTQYPDHVRATLRTSDGDWSEVSAVWVAGCDGAHSAVRHLNAMDFPGAPYEQVFFVADVQLSGDMVPDELNVFLWHQRFHLFFPMRGQDHWRLVGIVPPELRDKPDLAMADVLPALLREAGAGLSFHACSWFSVYRIHHRCASRFRDRRCFLLGDAAHIHSPVGAQGMNTGLQDAYNLAWKLALVVSGRAGEALLESYEAERLPVARRLLETTDRAFSLIVSERRIAALLRTRLLARVVALAMRSERVRLLAFRTISQIGIAYRDSSLACAAADMPAQGPRPGERWPWLRLVLRPGGEVEDGFARLDDSGFNLILIGQEAPADVPHADMVRVHTLPDDAGNRRQLARWQIPQRAFYLLRPDGHIGLAGTHFNAATMARYLSQSLHMHAARR